MQAQLNGLQPTNNDGKHAIALTEPYVAEIAIEGTTAHHEQFSQGLPGVYYHLPADDYHALHICSNSALTLLKQSPAHLQANRQTPRESTPAQQLGEAIHFCVLEPDLFADRYAQQPKFDRRTKAGKADYESWCADNPGKTGLDEDDWTLCHAIRENVYAHPKARRLLELAEASEVSAIFEHPLDCKVKVRADLPVPRVRTVVDLKTTRDARPEEFMRSIHNFGYARQGELYCQAFTANDVDIERFAIIAVETSWPVVQDAVCVYELTEEARDHARRELEQLIPIYTQCERTGFWPGYPRDVIPIGLPPWAMRTTYE